MGKNSVPGNRKPDQRTLPPVARAVAAAGVLAASVYAVNLSAGAAEAPRLARSVSETGTTAGAAAMDGIFGTFNGAASDSGAALSVADQSGAAPLQSTIRSSPQATLAFPHTAIGGADPGTAAALTVGPAGAGRPLAGFLMAPLQFLNPSSPFGFRVSPISGSAGDFHLGQDYAAPCGTPVYAADSGVVRAAGWHPWGGGNRIEIDHGDGLITTYNHLESIGVHTGDQVRVGQVIARVGTTGWSTGCHLHFEAVLNGRYTNPLRWTFLQLRAMNQAFPADMVSYAPGAGLAGGRISWTIPLQVDPGDGLPAAGLQASPFPPPPVPGPAASPSQPTGIVLPPPDAQLTTTAPPTAEPSDSAVPAPSGPATASPAPTSPTEPAPSDPASPSPSPTDPAPTDPASPSPSPTAPAPTEPAPSDPASPSPSPTEPAPTDPASPSPTEPAPTEPVPTDPAPTEPAPTDPVSPPPPPSPVQPEPAPVEPAPVEPVPAPVPVNVEPVPAPVPVEPVPAPVDPVPAPAPTTATPEPGPTVPPAESAPSPAPAPAVSEPSPTAPPP